MVKKSSRWDSPEELQQRREAFANGNSTPKFEPASPEALIARNESMRRMADQEQQRDQNGAGAAGATHGATSAGAEPHTAGIPIAVPAPAGSAQGALAVAEEVRMVPLDLIDPNPQNSRSGYSTAEVEDMRKDLKLAGRQLSPLSLEEYIAASGQKRFYCIDGFTRVQAMRIDGWTEAKATFTGTLTPLERYIRSLVANDATRHTTDFDHGIMWTKLISEDGITRQQIIETVGDRRASPATLSKVLSIAKLPASVVKLIGENKFVVAHSKYYLLYQIYEAFKRKHGEERAEELVFEKAQLVVADPSFTVDRLEEEAKAAGEDPGESGAGSTRAGSQAAGAGQRSNRAPVQEVALTRMGMGVGKMVRPEKGGLKIAIDKRLPKEVVDQIHEAVIKIIEGQPA